MWKCWNLELISKAIATLLPEEQMVIEVSMTLDNFDSTPGSDKLKQAGMTRSKFNEVRNTAKAKMLEYFADLAIFSITDLDFETPAHSSDHMRSRITPSHLAAPVDDVDHGLDDVPLEASGSPTSDSDDQTDMWAPRPVKIVYSNPELPPAPKANIPRNIGRPKKESTAKNCKKPVTLDGVTYPSQSDAMTALDISRDRLMRLLSPREKKKLPPCINCGAEKILARGLCKKCYQIWYRSQPAPLTAEINIQDIPGSSPSIDRDDDDVCSGQQSGICPTQECLKAVADS